jgi:predicted GNAT family acetyltransferase
MLRTASGVRQLGPTDLAQLRQLLDRDPIANVFVDHQVEVTGIDPRRTGGAIWGYLRRNELRAACHAGANLVPVGADPEATAAFADHAAGQTRMSSSIVGPRGMVLPLWERLESVWGPARQVRADQPLLTIRTPSSVRSDPLVRRVVLDELDVLYPACVAMFTEEVGVSPEPSGGGHYRARVAQLISRGWAFARIEGGQVVFKAEVGVATPKACQIQGVYVHPERRGTGIAAPAMAAVVELALREIAPVVSLYVNAGNVPALRAYRRVGFAQEGTFSTVLF